MDDKIISVTDSSLSEISSLSEHPGIKLFEEHARKTREESTNTKTPESYIKWKEGGNVGGQKVYFPYPTKAYMFSEFNRLYPLHKFKIISTKFIPEVFSVEVVMEVTDLKTGVTEIGVGAARAQIKKTARDLAEAGTKMPTPFDVVSYDSAIKSARSQAKKDGIKEFNVCADVYKLIVIPEDILNGWTISYNKIVDEHVIQPVENMKWKTRWEKEPLEGRGELLQKTMEHFGVEIKTEETDEEEI